MEKNWRKSNREYYTEFQESWDKIWADKTDSNINKHIKARLLINCLTTLEIDFERVNKDEIEWYQYMLANFLPSECQWFENAHRQDKAQKYKSNPKFD